MKDYTKRGQPRKPTAAELEALVDYHINTSFNLGEDERDDVKDAIENAHIAVFDDYATDCVGYRGRVMFVVFGKSPQHYELFTFNLKGDLEQEEPDSDMFDPYA